MRNLFSCDYQIFFYGKNFEAFLNYSKKYVKSTSLKHAEPKQYPEAATGGNVYFTSYDMVQTEMSRVGKGQNVEVKDFGAVNVFNEYFGRGLSSIVFQEIREAKSLAYSAYVSYQANGELNHPDYVQTYIGTQPDKLNIAVETLADLMKDLPQIPLQFENAKNMVLKQIASTRITRTNIFFNTLKLQKLGISYDYRKDIYQEVSKLKLSDLTDFYNSKVKPIRFNTAIIGKKENLNLDAVSKMGEFKELTLEEIFGY
jgi:predicted Zn-dependent peptidase